MTEDRVSKNAWPYPIRAVAFDMDGLMLNTEELYFEVGSELLGRRGKEFSQTLRRGMMGLPGRLAFELMITSESLSDSIDELEAESDAIFDELLKTRLAPMPGLIALLDELDRVGLPRCVATSSRRVFAEVALAGVNVLQRVNFIVTAEDVVRGKPSPDIYLEAAKRMHVDVRNMLVLEDSQHGTKAGVSSGACTISVPGDHSRDHNFDGAHAIATSLADPCISGLLTTASHK